MCRSQSGSQEARRCPCDSSDARLNRRSNAKMKAEHSGSLSTLTPARDLPSLIDEKTVTVEEVKQEINHLNTLLVTTETTDADIDTAVIKVGEGIQSLAEKEHGSPTDEEFANLISPDQKLAAELKEQIEEYAEEFNTLYYKFRNEVALRNPRFHGAQFARTEELVEVGLSEEKADQLRDIKSKQEAVVAQVGKLRDSLNVEEYNKNYTEALKKRNVAMQAALESVGVELADPETLVAGEKSQKGAIAAVKSALPFYPQSWVDKSNERQSSGTALVLKMSKRRAHYADLSTQKTYTVEPLQSVLSKPVGWEPDTSTRVGQEFIKATDNGDGTWTNPVNGKVVESSVDGYEVWVKQSYSYSMHEGKPSGTKWEQVTFADKKWLRDENEWEYNEVTRWRRPSVVRRRGTTTLSSELTINAEQNPLSDVSGNRVGMHEVAHRFETTIPALPRAERAFLNRRSGAGSPTGQEPLTPIYSGKSERGYKDSFNSHYMGKVYRGNNAYEIMSMGMESMFAGSNNGLTHNATSMLPPDDDYRKFILGALTIRPR